jgi:hypothetical protein
LTALTQQQMSIRATPCVGYWAAYYVNRDGDWSVACDALGRTIRCETEKLALSVARYRRRRLRPLREENPNLAHSNMRPTVSEAAFQRTNVNSLGSPKVSSAPFS